MLDVQTGTASPLPTSADPEILDRPSPSPASSAETRNGDRPSSLSAIGAAAGSTLARSSEQSSFSSHNGMTREEMESRRFDAAGAFRLGLSQIAVARQFGVSRTTASRWARSYREGGVDSMRTRRAGGRPRRLTVKQRAQLAEIVNQDPGEFGLDQWTTQQLAIVIEDRFGVRYHADHVGRILHQLFPDGGLMFWRRGGAR